MKKTIIALMLTIGPALYSPAAKAATPEDTVSQFVSQFYTAMRLPTASERLNGKGSTRGLCQVVQDYVDIDSMIIRLVAGFNDAKKQKFTLAVKSFLIKQ